MALTTIAMTPALHRYLLQHGVRETPELARLRERASKLPERDMMSGPEVAGLVALMVEIIGATSVIEVGAFVGYTTLWMALALPPGGHIIACDISEHYTDYGRAAWAEAGVADRIELRLAPALDTLDASLADGKAGTVDLVFIDADKGNYLPYYEKAMQLLRVGGLVLVDNVLWSGQVADPSDQGEGTLAIRALNERVRSDKRVHVSLVPIGDGLTIARKISDQRCDTVQPIV